MVKTQTGLLDWLQQSLPSAVGLRQPTTTEWTGYVICLPRAIASITKLQACARLLEVSVHCFTPHNSTAVSIVAT